MGNLNDFFMMVIKKSPTFRNEKGSEFVQTKQERSNHNL